MTTDFDSQDAFIDFLKRVHFSTSWALEVTPAEQEDIETVVQQLLETTAGLELCKKFIESGVPINISADSANALSVTKYPDSYELTYERHKVAHG